jgi:putative transposase
MFLAEVIPCRVRARFILPDISLYVIQRVNNSQACFFADWYYSVYLDCLGEHASKMGCRVHSYVLMTTMYIF